MDNEVRSLNEILAAANVSFDPSLWRFAFARTIPIAIYVDAGDESSQEIAEIVAARLNVELTKLEFESPEVLTSCSGSYFRLALSRTPRTDTGAQTESKLRRLRKQLIKYLQTGFFNELKELKQAGKDVHNIVKIVVSVGTIVVLLTAMPAAGLVVGSFVIPAQAWSMLAVAKEAGDIVGTASKLFTESEVATEAMKRTPSESDPVLFQEASEKRFSELEEKYEKRFHEQEERVQKLQEEVRGLRSMPGKP
jgi:hypothetical protein